METQNRVNTKKMSKKPIPNIYKDSKGEWRAEIKANNGKTIFASSEGYVKKKDCLTNLKSIAESLFYATDENHVPFIYTEND